MIENIILHVGTEKTGSTLIQQTLRKNRSRLAKLGYYIPDTGRAASHHYNLARAMGFSSGSSLDCAEKNAIMSSLREELGPCGESSLILSSEHFDVNASHETCQNVQDFFPGCHIQVILYLRNQIDYAQSLYAEYIKWGGIFSFPDYLSNEIVNEKFNHLRRYQLWSEHCDTLKIIDYDSRKKDLVKPFLEATAIAASANKLKIKNNTLNISPSIDFLEFVRQLNTRFQPQQRRENFVRQYRHFQRHNRKALQPRNWRFPQGFDTFLASSDEQNHQLAELASIDPDTFLGGSLSGRYQSLQEYSDPSILNIVDRLKHPDGSRLRLRLP